jgi:hypothetical protein
LYVGEGHIEKSRLHARTPGHRPDGGAITVPLIEAAGFDKVWFCVLFLVMLQTGYLTPPMREADGITSQPTGAGHANGVGKISFRRSDQRRDGYS